MDKIIIEYRDTEGGDWVRCASDWTQKDIAFFNKAVGYQKYRARRMSVVNS